MEPENEHLWKASFLHMFISEGVTEDFMGVIGQQTSQNPWVEKMLFDPRTTDAVLNEEILNPWVVTNLEGAMAIAGLCQLLYK